MSIQPLMAPAPAAVPGAGAGQGGEADATGFADLLTSLLGEPAAPEEEPTEEAMTEEAVTEEALAGQLVGDPAALLPGVADLAVADLAVATPGAPVDGAGTDVVQSGGPSDQIAGPPTAPDPEVVQVRGAGEKVAGGTANPQVEGGTAAVAVPSEVLQVAVSGDQVAGRTAEPAADVRDTPGPSDQVARPLTAPGSDGLHSDGQDDQNAGRAAPTPASTSPAPSIATAASAPPAPTAPAAPAAPPTPPTPASPALASQVIERISNLVQRDGTSRITIKLQPEALGELRVVVSVRDGAVQVRVAGGDAAAQALAQDAPELRRLLEQAGATDTRVQIRDSAGQSTYSSDSRADHGTTYGDRSDHSGHSDRQQGQPFDTTDQFNPTRGRATVPHHDQPGQSGRSSGLDLTI